MTMLLRSLVRKFESRSYNRLDKDADDEEFLEKSLSRYNDKQNGNPSWLVFCFFILLAIAIALAGIAGYLFHILRLLSWSESNQIEGTVTRVRIGTVKKIFQYNTTFAAPPPEDGGPEPIWDSMIPNGLGYIEDTSTAAPETSVLSTFHQLHCLYTIRRAFYSSSKSGDLEDFDLGKDRRPHVAHCFDYLRQGILCSADSSIEPAVDTVNGFLGGGFPRHCRNFSQLKDWAEEHRAFDAHGFLVDKMS